MSRRTKFEYTFRKRLIEIPFLNLVFYLLAFLSLVILLNFSLPNLQTQTIIHSDPVVNEVLWIHIASINFWLLCIFGLIPSVASTLEEPRPVEPIPLMKEEEKITWDRDFYLARVDSMDRLIHYMRSGTSILLGLVTAVILWFLNFDPILNPLAEPLFIGSICLAAFTVFSLLTSFGDVSVRMYGTTLEEDLIPHGQTTSQYIAQIREILINKRNINRKMKRRVGLGLLLFIVVPPALILQPLMLPLSELTSNTFASTLYGISVVLMMIVILFIGLLLVNNLGIQVLLEDENAEGV